MWEQVVYGDYCMHGTAIGLPGGADLMCGLCEMGQTHLTPVTYQWSRLVAVDERNFVVARSSWTCDWERRPSMAQRLEDTGLLVYEARNEAGVDWFDPSESPETPCARECPTCIDASRWAPEYDRRSH